MALPALLGALVLAPLYWLAVPERWRREALLAASAIGLALLDPRLPLLVLVVASGVWAVVRAVSGGRRSRRASWVIALPALAALAALFVVNKQGGSAGLLPSQGGLLLLGVSYLVLKAAAVIVDATRGSLRQAPFLDLLAWIAFLPTYTSGPIEPFAHFRALQPRPDLARLLGGLERILFGLVKTMLLAHALGAWGAPILGDPAAHSPAVLLLAAWACVLRFYFDFAGYSDIAIGVAALFGVEIQENFDNPLVRRNLAQLWQRWHMTLTAWLRRYLFLPVSRGVLGPGGASRDTLALVVAQAVTMSFCGLWHGLGWNFLVWGLLQALGLVWVGRPARSVGRLLPERVRFFWRETRAGYALSAFLTFNYFALSSVLVFTGLDGARVYATHLLGG
jgi:alginate O-acetyltransferase complex protein AlgI